MIKIDRGVPMPEYPKSRKRGRECKYPWKNMEIGDSFVVEIEFRDSVASSISKLNRKKVYGKKRFDWVDVHENGMEYIRVWRINDAND